MKAEIMKRLFKGIFSEDIASLKKIAQIIIVEERKLGHGVLATALKNILSAWARATTMPSAPSVNAAGI